MEVVKDQGISERVEPASSTPGPVGLSTTIVEDPKQELPTLPSQVELANLKASASSESMAGIQSAIRFMKDQSWAMTALAVLAVLVMIYLTRAILFPILLAIVLNLLFKPAILRLERWKIPPAIGAVLIIATMLTVLSFAVLFLWTPATTWLQSAPSIWQEVTEKLEPLRTSIARLNRASAEIEGLADEEEIEGEADRTDGRELTVRLQESRLAESIFFSSTTFLTYSVIVIALLYFLLADGDRFLEKLVYIMPTFHEKKNMVEMSRAIQKSISDYLITISIVNTLLGVTMGIAMWALGLPNAALWGVMACLLNFIPFLGATVGATIVFLVALFNFDTSYALLAPIVYALINSVEANFVTPSLLGRSMSISPVIIFVTLVVWGWMWGIGGVLLAVPLLVVVKIICDHIERLTPIGQLLER